jgi:predicted acetyltransferase
MEIEVSPVEKKDKEILKKMIEVYEKEMLGEDAGEYKYFDCYWEDKNRWPFFIRANHEIIGFVLVNQHCLTENTIKNLGEFFIEKKYRKQGFGLKAAGIVFDMFKEKWEVREINENPAARDFWLKVINEYTKGKYKDTFTNNEEWHGWIQTFDNST